jgi:hypothetical protein
MSSRVDFVIEKLTKLPDLNSLDCGHESLNQWLRRFAWTNVQNDSARVYVAHRGNGVASGYYAITAGSVSRAEAPDRVGRGLAAHPIGVVVLGRLAVDIKEQGKGLGKASCGTLCNASNKQPTSLVCGRCWWTPSMKPHAHFTCATASPRRRLMNCG